MIEADLSNPLFPVFVTGLHCGRSHADALRFAAARLFPVFVTGLHCGTPEQIKKIRGGKVLFPVFVTGLHCGSIESRRVVTEVISSRSS